MDDKINVTEWITTGRRILRNFGARVSTNFMMCSPIGVPGGILPDEGSSSDDQVDEEQHVGDQGNSDTESESTINFAEPNEPIETPPSENNEREEETSQLLEGLDLNPSSSQINPVDPAEKTAEVVYGGCTGPNSAYVSILSKDDFEFVIKREHAMMSNTLKRILHDPRLEFREDDLVQIRLPAFSTPCLQIICRYLGYKYYCLNNSIPKDPFDFPEEMAMDLLIAVHALDC